MSAHDKRKSSASRSSRNNTKGRQSDAGGERIYWEHEAEHLSTLTTSASRPPPDPESSLRRLHQLADNKQLSITPVKLVLRERRLKPELLVTNLETGDVCECILLDDIITPIYKESNDPSDSYNNLLMFNVNACLNSKNGPTQHEMHIFQCVSAPAHEIVDALIDIQENPHGFLSPAVEKYSEVAEPIQQNNRASPESGIEMPPYQLKDKAMIDGEILLLNMCFDDIEGYVGQIYKLQRARWQNASQAEPSDDNVSVAGNDAKGGKEKKKRFVFKKRNGSPKKEKSDMSRVASSTSFMSEVEIPISDEELIDLFEKIKFSVILLSRLQGYVTEPNPPLLTHKLFSMMKQPVDFIRDPVTGEPDMVRKVISPLFPEDAIKLIQNSLIEPELSLWRELGKGWCLAKEQWDVSVPTYIPQFKCGFKPAPEQYHYTLFDLPPGKGSEMHPSASRLKLADMQAQAEYLDILRKKGAKIARVRRDFVGESEQEISLKAGEYVEVLNDSLNWNHLRNRKGTEGYAPYTILDYNAA